MSENPIPWNLSCNSSFLFVVRSQESGLPLTVNLNSAKRLNPSRLHYYACFYSPWARKESTDKVSVPSFNSSNTTSSIIALPTLSPCSYASNCKISFVCSFSSPNPDSLAKKYLDFEYFLSSHTRNASSSPHQYGHKQQRPSALGFLFSSL